MKHLYFVRHALSEMNKKGLFSGRTNTPLASEGIVEAKNVGEHAKKLHVDLIVSSPMERCRETATIIAEVIGYPADKIIFSDLFVERELGILEGTTYEPNKVSDETEGVETSNAILRRAQEGLDFLEEQGHENVLLVSHSALGRAIRHILHPHVPYHGSESFENAKIVQLL